MYIYLFKPHHIFNAVVLFILSSNGYVWAQTSGITCVGDNGNGSMRAPCTEILRFDNYDDNLAGSSSGQNFIFTLLNRFSLSFNLKRSGAPLHAITAPCFPESPFGYFGYTGLSGETIIYQVQNASITTLDFSNIILKDAVGNVINDFSIIAFDAETTDSTETTSLTTNSGISWFVWDSIIPPVSPTSLPIETGIGTNHVIWSGNPPFGTPVSRSIAANSPTSISITLNSGIQQLEGLQATALGIKRIIIAPNDTICSNSSAIINPINASAGTNYTWTAPTINPSGSITGSSAQSNEVAMINQLLINNTTVPATATYTITPISCGLTGNSFTATVVINPSNISAGPDQTISCNTSATMAATGSGTWTAVPGNPSNATVTAPSSSTTTITGLNEDGVYYFVWGNNQCTDTVVITIIAKPTVTITANNSLCGDSGIMLTATGLPSGNKYHWSQGSTTNSIIVNPMVTTNYKVIYGSTGCSVSDSFIVAAITKPSTNIIEITPAIDTLALGQSVVLVSTYHASDSFHVTYSWSPPEGLSCTNCAAPVATPLTSTTYMLVFKDSAGCMTTDSAIIFVTDTHTLYIPNAFSPNGDGKNDIFLIYGAGIGEIDLKIFDRWGELVFETRDKKEGWDGKLKGQLMDPGVFVYDALVTFLDNSQKSAKGSFLLIR